MFKFKYGRKYTLYALYNAYNKLNLHVILKTWILEKIELKYVPSN